MILLQYFSQQQVKNGGWGQSLQKTFGTTPFQSKENALFEIKRALQRGNLCSLAEKGRGQDPQDPSPSCTPGHKTAKHIDYLIQWEKVKMANRDKDNTTVVGNF